MLSDIGGGENEKLWLHGYGDSVWIERIKVELDSGKWLYKIVNILPMNCTPQKMVKMANFGIYILPQ